MATNGKRDWKVPENLSELAWLAENNRADEVPSIAAEEAQAAFLEAEAISRRLGGTFFIQPLRVQRSDGWVTAGYLIHHESFVPAVRPRDVPVGIDEELPPVVDHAPPKLRALERDLQDRLDAATEEEAEVLTEQLEAVRREIESSNGVTAGA